MKRFIKFLHEKLKDAKVKGYCDLDLFVPLLALCGTYVAQNLTQYTIGMKTTVLHGAKWGAAIGGVLSALCLAIDAVLKLKLYFGAGEARGYKFGRVFTFDFIFTALGVVLNWGYIFFPTLVGWREPGEKVFIMIVVPVSVVVCVFFLLPTLLSGLKYKKEKQTPGA